MQQRDVRKKGYPLGFHFDPIIFHEGWEKGYQEDRSFLFSTQIDPKRVVWISLGGFRYPPQLKGIARERFPKTRIFLGELFPGKDGKFRYFKEIRVEMYRKMVGWLKRGGSRSVYLSLHGEQRGVGKSFWLGTNEQQSFEPVV